MRFKKQVKQAFDDLQDTLDQDFSNVKVDIDAIHGRIDQWALQHQGLSNEVRDLIKEIATNGVIRDIRKLQKDVAALVRENENHHTAFQNFKYELGHNGVATAINELRAEVFKTRKEKKEGIFSNRLIASMFGGEVPAPVEEPTLAGKVDAIIEHLGLDVTVKPEEVKPAKAVAKKVTAKKKGRR